MRRFVPKFHGGPEVKLPRSKDKSGLRQSEKLKHGPVLQVVKDGQIILNKRFRRALKNATVTALSPKPSVSASATPQKLLGRGGVPAKTEPPTRENRLSEGASPAYWDTAPSRPTEERTPGRDRGLH